MEVQDFVRQYSRIDGLPALKTESRWSLIARDDEEIPEPCSVQGPFLVFKEKVVLASKLIGVLPIDQNGIVMSNGDRSLLLLEGEHKLVVDASHTKVMEAYIRWCNGTKNQVDPVG